MHRPLRSIRLSLSVMAPFLALALVTENSAEAASGDQLAAVPDSTPSHYKNTPEKARPVAGSVTHRQIGGNWWTIFHDHTLDTLETSALTANDDLRSSVARVIEARQQMLAAAADFYPHLDAALRGSRQRTTNTGPLQHGRFLGAPASSLTAGLPGAAASANPLGNLFEKAITTQPLTATYNDFRTPLTLTYEVDVFGRIRGTYGQARATAQAVEADRRAVELSLTAQVATNYFALRAFDAQTAVLRRTVSLRQEEVRLQKERADLGAGNALDVARAQVELDNAQSDLADVGRLRAQAENGLAALCGQVASEFHLPPQPLAIEQLPTVPTGIPARLAAQRPDLIEGERRVAATAEGIRVARAELLPSFNLQGDAGYESAHAGDLTEWQSRIWDIMATVKIPIFEGGRNLANLRAARARREEALAAYQQTALNAFKEVENALAELHQRAIQGSAREKAFTDAGLVLKYSEDRYKEGAVTYFEVIDAERLLLSAELGRIETWNSRYAATIELVRSLGGSFAESDAKSR